MLAVVATRAHKKGTPASRNLLFVPTHTHGMHKSRNALRPGNYRFPFKKSDKNQHLQVKSSHVRIHSKRVKSSQVKSMIDPYRLRIEIVSLTLSDIVCLWVGLGRGICELCGCVPCEAVDQTSKTPGGAGTHPRQTRKTRKTEETNLKRTYRITGTDVCLLGVPAPPARVSLNRSVSFYRKKTPGERGSRDTHGTHTGHTGATDAGQTTTQPEQGGRRPLWTAPQAVYCRRPRAAKYRRERSKDIDWTTAVCAPTGAAVPVRLYQSAVRASSAAAAATYSVRTRDALVLKRPPPRHLPVDVALVALAFCRA